MNTNSLVGRIVKPVRYYCPSCRTRMTRLVPRAAASILSWCGRVNRTVRIRKLKDQTL